MSQLGTLEELPLDYRDALTAQNLVPLWPSLRAALPYDIPTRRTQAVAWHYANIRPRLLEAGELTPIEKAERRVLVLANPGVAVATPAVFRALTRRDNAGLPHDMPRVTTAADLATWLRLTRNDLEAPALTLAPVIGTTLRALSAQPGCLLARMSGSGATCFGLFETAALAEAAAARLARPGWWVWGGQVLPAA